MTNHSMRQFFEAEFASGTPGKPVQMKSLAAPVQPANDNVPGSAGFYIGLLAFALWCYFAFIPAMASFLSREFAHNDWCVVEAVRMLYGFNWRIVLLCGIVPFSLVTGIAMGACAKDWHLMMLYSLAVLSAIMAAPIAVAFAIVGIVLFIVVCFAAGPFFIACLAWEGGSSIKLVAVGVFVFMICAIIIVPVIVWIV